MKKWAGSLLAKWDHEARNRNGVPPRCEWCGVYRNDRPYMPPPTKRPRFTARWGELDDGELCQKCEWKFFAMCEAEYAAEDDRPAPEGGRR